MIAVDVMGFAHALADERLLEPAQYDAFVNAMLPQCQDVSILARELVYRGWLTPFQAEQILLGQQEDLILDSYVLLDVIGSGGMGRVYRARNWKLNRIVAIKLIVEDQFQNPGTIARFQREIRAMGRICHPNIVLALDADFRPGRIYYAMEYFDGIDLGGYVRQNGPLSIEESSNYILQAADALNHAHRAGLVHRDIKPSNLLLTHPDRIVKLLDLGLTRSEISVNDSVFMELTRAGALIGTPDYMPPEQVIDSRDVDVRSDLYSLGCTWYHLLTGGPPFDSLPAIVDKLHAQCELEPAAVEKLRPDLPAPFTAVIRKLMAKRRSDRYQTPARFAEHLSMLLNASRLSSSQTLIDARSPTLSESAAGSCVRHTESPTLALEDGELGLVLPGTKIEPRLKTRRLQQASSGRWHYAVAILIASIALLVLWMSGSGPAPKRYEAGGVPEPDQAGQAASDHVPMGDGDEPPAISPRVPNALEGASLDPSGN